MSKQPSLRFSPLLALGGCSGRDPRGFLAQASESEVQSTRIKGKEAICERITHHAKLNEIPESLIHRVVLRESRYDPAARHGRYWGLMQISHATAKSMGYSGPPIGLLDPETNLKYAVAYLANAYRVAGGDEKRAQKLYERGFYYDAKRAGRLGLLHAALEDASEPKRAEAQNAGAHGQRTAGRHANRLRGAGLGRLGSGRARAQSRQCGKPSQFRVFRQGFGGKAGSRRQGEGPP